MATSSAPIRSVSLPNQWSFSFSNFAWLVVAWNVLVIVEGAFVRATGSGAGCGDHWPLCNGQVVVGSPSTATLIEYAHRSMTGIDSLLVLAMSVWGFRRFAKGHPVRWAIKLSLFFLVMEALLGALLVKLRLVVNDESVMRAVFLSIHLANTLTLMACLTLTAWWGENRPRRAPGLGGWAMLAGVAFTGIAGALAALADTLHPAKSLAQGLAEDFNPNASLLVHLRMIHPFLAIAVTGWVVYRCLKSSSPVPAEIRRLVPFFAVGQLITGLANILFLAPIGVQLLHLLLADCLWIVLVAFVWWSAPAQTSYLVER